VYTHHYFKYGLAMSSLKSFLYAVAPVFGITPAALYERQRTLVKLGLLTAVPGRGPGSGVALSADSVAVMVICVLAAETLGDVDQRITAICDALPEGGGPTFRSDIARVLSGQQALHWSAGRMTYSGIRVSRCWRGQIIRGTQALQSRDYHVAGPRPDRTISITAEIDGQMLSQLIAFTQGALSQTLVEEDDQ
jgi:hypothetical protein